MCELNVLTPTSHAYTNEVSTIVYQSLRWSYMAILNSVEYWMLLAVCYFLMLGYNYRYSQSRSYLISSSHSCCYTVRRKCHPNRFPSTENHKVVLIKIGFEFFFIIIA